MRIAAPGKLLFTGAYAVLEGAPAVVVAVDRFVVADTDRAPNANVRPEVAAVARRLESTAPFIDSSALEEGDRKLGLGSSAAGAVACAGALLVRAGVALDESGVERALTVALAAHAESQPRGSGADVVACAMGGVVEVVRRRGAIERRATRLPSGTIWRAFRCGAAARTSDALDRLAERRATLEATDAMRAIAAAAQYGADACRSDDALGFVRACAEHVVGLRSLGAAIDLPLVPPEVGLAQARFDATAENRPETRGVLLPSGAGGGDVVLWVGIRTPTDHETRALLDAGLAPLDLSMSSLGVHRIDALASDQEIK